MGPRPLPTRPYCPESIEIYLYEFLLSKHYNPYSLIYMTLSIKLSKDEKKHGSLWNYILFRKITKCHMIWENSKTMRVSLSFLFSLGRGDANTHEMMTLYYFKNKIFEGVKYFAYTITPKIYLKFTRKFNLYLAGTMYIVVFVMKKSDTPCLSYTTSTIIRFWMTKSDADIFTSLYFMSTFPLKPLKFGHVCFLRQLFRKTISGLST